MFSRIFSLACVLTIFNARLARGHASIFHPSMWGFNVTDHTYPYDNRPVAPLADYTFQQWWFHGHLDHPPNPGDLFELPAGKPATTEIACNKGATSFFASSEGGDIRSGDDPCPGRPTTEYHTNGPDDLKGCSLAIAYKSDVNQVQPEDFTVFSVNQTCVFHRFTDFQVPKRMPPCPEGGCICAWFWIHSEDSGGEQNYMTGFRCNVTDSTSNVALAKPQLPRRCGADPENGKPDPAPGNCTYGAKQPFYWFQKERNNMFEGTYSPPFYLDLYNFKDGAQDDIFVDSYPGGIPPPGPNSTVIPTPFLGDGAAPLPTSAIPESSSAAASSVSAASILATTTSASAPASTGSSTSPQSATISSSPEVKSEPATVTVISVITVTSTAAASTTPVAEPATLTSTQLVTVTASVTVNDITTSVLVAGPPSNVVTSETPPPTIFLNNPAATPLSNLAGKKLAALDVVDSSSAASSPTSSVASSPTLANSTRVQCKRSDPSPQKRTKSLTSFSIPGFSHRRLTQRSRLWSIF